MLVVKYRNTDVFLISLCSNAEEKPTPGTDAALKLLTRFPKTMFINGKVWPSAISQHMMVNTYNSRSHCRGGSRSEEQEVHLPSIGKYPLSLASVVDMLLYYRPMHYTYNVMSKIRFWQLLFLAMSLFRFLLNSLRSRWLDHCGLSLFEAWRDNIDGVRFYVFGRHAG